MVFFKLRKICRFAAVLCLVLFAALAGLSGSLQVQPSAAHAQSAGNVPGGTLGNLNDPEMWRFARRGGCGTVSIPDKSAGCLVQADGDVWRAVKNGPLSEIGGWSMLGILVVLALFYILRGKIRVDAGLSGQTIERFNGTERFAHWLTASSFVVLGLTGLNVLYGRYVIKPLLGADAFSWLTMVGKFTHNYVGFAFMIGIALMFVLWIRDNIPSLVDLKWLAVGGGLFSKGVHPPSERFNAGQKFIFWAVVLGGGSLALSGVALLFPFEIHPWAGTFALLNKLGFALPTSLSALQETQLSSIWHSTLALVMIVIIVGHIYIGSVGMEGAIDAVGTGQVDLNWAKEHHSLWVEEHLDDVKNQPAE